MGEVDKNKWRWVVKRRLVAMVMVVESGWDSGGNEGELMGMVWASGLGG